MRTCLHLRKSLRLPQHPRNDPVQAKRVNARNGTKIRKRNLKPPRHVSLYPDSLSLFSLFLCFSLSCVTVPLNTEQKEVEFNSNICYLQIKVIGDKSTKESVSSTKLFKQLAAEARDTVSGKSVNYNAKPNASATSSRKNDASLKL